MARIAVRADPPALTLPYDATPLDTAPITTERLVLRPLREDDAEDVWRYQQLPEVLRYIPWPAWSKHEGLAHTRKRAAWRRLEADGDAVIFAMQLPDDSTEPGRVIGDVMLRVDRAEHAGLEIGWVVHPAFHGLGLAREAASAVLSFAFAELGAHRVQATLDARNEASARLCERLGMRLEATFIQDWWMRGEWTDTAIYATRTPPAAD
ncbi:GNAT family N-acetyltransferase [Agromyces silvae]|uniref:GNAT family N-acetyltransferase n=1 Tax=Agromyces silvae TaxID=3388266 RepID=UPI00280C2E8F|nr:GNAT family N-acetyltransferase [Agromyces protaetiae]